MIPPSRTLPDQPADGRPVLPLAMVEAGQVVELVFVQGGRGLQQRLAEMRLGPGTVFRVETCGRPGPFVIGVGHSRLVLGHGMVQRVFVRPVPEAAREGDSP